MIKAQAVHLQKSSLPAEKSVFDFAQDVVDAYSSFAKSFQHIAAADIRSALATSYGSKKFWPDPLLQISPSYEAALETLDVLVENKVLAPQCADIFTPPGDGAARKPLSLHGHQLRAIYAAIHGRNFVLTSGTGSGKSLSYFIPIVSSVLQQKQTDKKPRTRAIIVYPMNALANSQEQEINKYLSQTKEKVPLRVARFTGEVAFTRARGNEADPSETTRAEIASDPPDILLTNFFMLEMLMTRQDDLDRQVLANCAGLQFLVLDELHTYRGRQGSDLAMLVRRLKQRTRDKDLSSKPMLCIGTSATMTNKGDEDSQSAAVAKVGGDLFGIPMREVEVIVEDLRRVTNGAISRQQASTMLGGRLDPAEIAKLTEQELIDHPLAVWLETTLGVVQQGNKRMRRARPLCMEEIARDLAGLCGQSVETCTAGIQAMLVRGSQARTDAAGQKISARPKLPLKLHQFFGAAGHVYATLGRPGEREILLEYERSETLLLDTFFCRECGQEFHPVRWEYQNGGWQVTRPPPDDAPEEETVADEPSFLTEPSFIYRGFLMPHSTTEPYDACESRCYAKADVSRSKKTEGELLPRHQWKAPIAGMVDVSGHWGVGRLPVFALRGPFRHCPKCHNTPLGRSRRLAKLTAEGRTSSCTVLSTSILARMEQQRPALRDDQRKLLVFTDNRQDAAIQAGNFNDSTFVYALRGALLAALRRQASGELRGDELGAAIASTLGLSPDTLPARQRWLRNPDLVGASRQAASAALHAMLLHRAWLDFGRSWRLTNPNLEACSLVGFEYLQLQELCQNQQAFRQAGGHPRLLEASPDVRYEVYRRLFRHMRRQLAVRSYALSADHFTSFVIDGHKYLCDPWGPGEKARETVRRLVIEPDADTSRQPHEASPQVSGTYTSKLGRILKDTELWGLDQRDQVVQSQEDYTELVQSLLQAASSSGLTVKIPRQDGADEGWALSLDQVLLLGPTSARFAAEEKGYARKNPYFGALYDQVAASMQDAKGAPSAWLSFEAREHTAQVSNEVRQLREKRFRWDKAARMRLDEPGQRQLLQDHGERASRLPLLVCSPTMELGVDIADLNVVLLRNVPPTPASYVQRGGRAGRQGEAALIVTYCAAQSPHDQYFFRHRDQMVHGEVAAPVIDVYNEELVASHLRAEWLAASQMPLSATPAGVLDGENNWEVNAELAQRLQSAPVQRAAIAAATALLTDLLQMAGKRQPDWLLGSAEQHATSVISGAFAQFDGAFKRWRELYRAAEDAESHWAREKNNRSRPPQDRQRASEEEEISFQQKLALEGGHAEKSSEFYTYRYLATEGFLPGYNFPRLPLYAFLRDRGEKAGKKAILQRPKFLALSEFGPQTVIYHEGKQFRVTMQNLSAGQRGRGFGALTTQQLRSCKLCGNCWQEESRSTCSGCGSGDEPYLHTNLLESGNVQADRVDYITADDEERQRRGFDVTTCHSWAQVQEGSRRLGVAVADAAGPVATLTYGATASLYRINHGLRRANREGFYIDAATGRWTAAPVAPEAKGRAASRRRSPVPTYEAQRVFPYVRDVRNVLTFEFADTTLSTAELRSIEQALLRGLQASAHVEPSEVLTEKLPSSSEPTRGFLLYEASEGGMGVLHRLATDVAFRRDVAREALRTLHYDTSAIATGSARNMAMPSDQQACALACYRCLLSYYNQTYHHLLDRTLPGVVRTLCRLAEQLPTDDQETA